MNRMIKALYSRFCKGTYPTKYYIGSGAGASKYKLVAFDNALLDCGISDYNLVKVSSILPMDIKRTSRIELRKGSTLLTAFGHIESNIPGQLISSAVGTAIPVNPYDIGIIMEYAGTCSLNESKKIVHNMIAEAMENHSIAYEKIIISSKQEKVPDTGEYTSVISAISFW